MQYQIVLIFIGVCGTLVNSDVTTGDCSACQPNSKPELFAKLAPMCGLSFPVRDKAQKYIYEVGICRDVGTKGTKVKAKNVGVWQKEVTNKLGEGNEYVLGSLNQTEIMVGDNWIYLEYEGGQEYGNACGKEHRRSIIMITCKKGEYLGTMAMVEEDSNKTSHCHYLFQISNDAACTPEVQALTAGGIICIVFLTIVGAYLIFGALYMRCVRGAKGWKQIPNYEFWKDFGNLQADGCDLICRCGGRNSTVNHYHGIGDHQIESANDDDRDEHLLPM